MLSEWLDFKIPFPVEGCVLGLDPGKSGGVSLIDSSGEAVAWGLSSASRNSVADLFCFLSKFNPKMAFLEDVGSRPGQDCRASFTFGMQYERLFMGATCFNIKCQLVKPQEWQKAVGAPQAPKDKSLKAHIRKRIHKNDLKVMAQKTFPKLKVTLQTADALLIGLFGYNTIFGKSQL